MPEVHALTPWTIINDILPGVQLGKFFQIQGSQSRRILNSLTQSLKSITAVTKESTPVKEQATKSIIYGQIKRN